MLCVRQSWLFLFFFPLSVISPQEEDEFRDKLTPISLALNYSLAPPSRGQDIPPVLNHYSSTFLQEHVGICTYMQTQAKFVSVNLILCYISVTVSLMKKRHALLGNRKAFSLIKERIFLNLLVDIKLNFAFPHHRADEHGWSTKTFFHS